jgi:hypothetical protein
MSTLVAADTLMNTSVQTYACSPVHVSNEKHTSLSHSMKYCLVENGNSLFVDLSMPNNGFSHIPLKVTTYPFNFTHRGSAKGTTKKKDCSSKQQSKNPKTMICTHGQWELPSGKQTWLLKMANL